MSKFLFAVFEFLNYLPNGVNFACENRPRFRTKIRSGDFCDDAFDCFWSLSGDFLKLYLATLVDDFLVFFGWLKNWEMRWKKVGSPVAPFSSKTVQHSFCNFSAKILLKPTYVIFFCILLQHTYLYFDTYLVTTFEMSLFFSLFKTLESRKSFNNLFNKNIRDVTMKKTRYTCTNGVASPIPILFWIAMLKY